MIDPTVRLDLTPEEARALQSIVATSYHPTRQRITLEIEEQLEALRLARTNPELDTLRVVGQRLIRDVRAQIPAYCHAFLVLFEQSDVPGAPVVYTATRTDRRTIATIILDICRKWRDEGSLR